MDNKYLRSVNFNNKAKRVPICFLVDISRSMDEIIEGLEFCKITNKTIDDDGRHYGEMDPIIPGDPRVKTKTDLLAEGLGNFYQAIRDDDVACDSCVSEIITFRDTPRVFEDFDTVDNKAVPSFPQPKGNTNMTAAIKMALDTLDKQKELYKANKIPYFQPWLVIFTDGQPTDDLTNISSELKNRINANKLTVLVGPLTSDETAKNVLRQLIKGANKKNAAFIPLDNPTSIRKFFNFLVKSVSVTAANGIPKDFWDENDDD